MAPKRSLDLKETNERKSKPKKTRRVKKAYKRTTSDKIEPMNELFKACQSGNLEKVKQILEINKQITSKEIQEMKLLHTASHFGYIEIVKELLKYTMDIDDTNSVGDNALQIAAKAGHVKIVAILLAHGADVNFHLDVSKFNDDIEAYSYSSGDTRVLHVAARHGFNAMMKEILKHDVEIDVRTIHKETALHLASDRGHASVVAQLLEHGANVYLISEHHDIVSDKALHMASSRGHLEVVKELLKYDKEIDVKNEDGKTPLHLASENGRTKTVEELLDHGASIDLHVGSNPEGCNGLNCVSYCYPKGDALHLAIKSGNVETVQLLLNSGATQTNKCTATHFLEACEYGHLDVVKELIRRGANIHEQIDARHTMPPLHVAISHGNIEVVKELLRLGVDFNLDDEYYGTPLNVAAVDGHLEIVKLFLKLGANPYQKFKEYSPDYMPIGDALSNAYERGHHSIVEELLLHGNADAIVDDNKWTSLHHASDCGNLGAVKKLLAKGCDVNVETDDNRTPLFYAIEYVFLHEKSDDLVLYLLHHGANLNKQDLDGNTPLHKAVDIQLDEGKQYDMNVFEKILENGKDIDFNLKNKEGKSVLQIAIDKKYNKVTRMIAKRMCSKPRITDSIYPLKSFIARKHLISQQ